VASDDKGKFSAEISQKVIDDALRSVETARKPEVEVPTEVSEVPEQVQGAGTQSKALSEWEILRAELDASQAMSREMMGRLKDTHERMLRATADLENYRRRAQKEKEDVQRFGNEKVLRDFLPVIDNMDRAIEHANTGADLDSVKQGIEMTRKLFEETLAKHGVTRVAALGQRFDPAFHEAIQSIDRPDVPPNQVITEVVKGYMLKDRLMRPALVVVSKALEQPKAASPADESTSESNHPTAPGSVNG
jgi:molecular chaperone GrpE